MNTYTQETTSIPKILQDLGIEETNPAYSNGIDFYYNSNLLDSYSPIDGKKIASVGIATKPELEQVIQNAQRAFFYWRNIPAPKRGEVIRQIGDAFRSYKETLGTLVSLEMGKIYQEGLGEVQEIIDICDFAVGLSRQLYGLTMASERPFHRLYEQWHPLGLVGIISAFNFPVAVWAWNAMIAAVCGNVTIWKPSEKTPLCAIACFRIIHQVLLKNNLPPGIFNLVIGDATLGKELVADKRIALISATGSVRMGKAVAEIVAARLGKSLLELGGNNAIIITEKADLETAILPIVFAAVGTTGQRCTSARRLIVLEGIYEKVKTQLLQVYSQLRTRIGNPLEPNTLIGPLIDAQAVIMMQNALKQVQEEGGKLLFGGEVLHLPQYPQGHYVVPAIVEAQNHYITVQQETFAPILYLIRAKNLEEAINFQNQVPQGLSSSIFSTDMRETELFLSHAGSDCGIANVNIGPSGAEIGGAFGGEKETGGGRESGSDAWKAYMRRQTVTINYGRELTLAQGIRFEI
ncbi:MAG: aldehyde dehydrogenase family protein [Bacteroidia bacterium]|nr:aldehyde dehydrogenase family protein [Bacteroidia bacterium]MDW8159503.1 aldehyde dehydrogenase family protein [Bacteroidia bacterium]